MSTTQFHVQGMSCAGCAMSVERKLLATPGVHAAKVALASTQADVSFDEKVITPEQIKQVVSTLGFEAVD